MKLNHYKALLLVIISLVLAACSQSPLATPAPPQDDAPAATSETPAMPSEEESEEPTASPAPDSGGAEMPAQDAPQDALVNAQWVLESYGPPGAETPVVGETPLTIEFTTDGQVSGNAGCNSFAGGYQVQEDKLLLGELVSTLVACTDTTLMEQEVAYLDALQRVSDYRIEGDSLTLIYGEGEGTLNFTRASSTPEDSTPTETATPAPEAGVPAGESQALVWTCYTCYGSQVWSFENGEASQVELPIVIEYFFGYAPATGRILYSSPLPLLGGGPSTITVHDLWMYDVASGQAEPIFTEQNIVEAVWGPDGEQLAYIVATDTTYELRWRGLNGEDKLLASDVAFTFNVSPQGDKVAFTRESGYRLPGTPGLYVADVATGDEWLIADIDRAGSGSIDDKPVWSPSGQYVLLSTYGTPSQQGLVRAAADGSGSVTLGFDPALADEEWYEIEPFVPFWLDDSHFIAQAWLGGANAPMGGPSTLILYRLNEALDTIIDGEMMIRGAVIDWDVPGSSIWVQTEEGDIVSVPLPAIE
jgi:heat shock protein HslJ